MDFAIGQGEREAARTLAPREGTGWVEAVDSLLHTNHIVPGGQGGAQCVCAPAALPVA